MTKLRKKAFTIVELVIVIAVIAILATVLIPVFTGVVDNANKSADTQEVASINIHLATMEEIDSGDDLYNAIAEVYGEGKAKSFAPRTASQGYHYWYDINTKTIVVKSYEEIVSANSTFAVGVNSTSEKTLFNVSAKKGFAETEANSFRMFDGFYFLDNAGSALGETLDALDKGAQNLVNKVTKLAQLGADSKDKQLADKVLEKLEKVAIIANETTFVYNSDKVESFYFVSGITTVSNNVVICNGTNYIAKAQNVPNINLPETVTKVKENSLMFDTEGVVIKTVFASFAQVANVFQANSTNAKIEIADNSKCIVDGNKLVDENDVTVGVLEYSNKVSKFELICPQGDGYVYDKAKATLYVKHNLDGDLTFNLDTEILEAVDENNNAIDLSIVEDDMLWTWEELDNSVVFAENGLVTIDAPKQYSASKDYSRKVTIQSVTNNSFKVELTIKVVTMMNAVAKVGENQLMLDNTTVNNAFTITYDGSETSAIYNISDFACTYNYSGIFDTCCGDVKPEFITEGDLFSIVDGKLTLNTQAYELSGTQMLKVKVLGHIEKTFTVTVVDNSSAEFTKKFTNNYLYRVGNGNAITLGSLFYTEDKVKDVSVVIYDASKTIGNTLVAIGSSGFTAQYNENSDWEESTIKFSGTGVAIVEIQDGNGTVVRVAVEVVNAKNVIQASDFSGATNYVLLNDITWGVTKNVTIQGLVFGNGFAINAQYFTASAKENNAIFRLASGKIDNLVINGPVYPELIYMSEASENKPYYVAGIYATGNATITNSYISGFREPIMANGSSLYLENTTLVGGNYANLCLQTGSLRLKDVTTVQEKTISTVGSATVIGAGIIVEEGISKTADIVIEGEFNQYNWICESDSSCFSNAVWTLLKTVFNKTELCHTINGVKYANAGILFVGGRDSADGIDNRTDKETAQYGLVNVSGSFMGVSVSATVYSYLSTKQINEVPVYGGYVSSVQGVLEPTFKHNLTLVNGAVDISIDVINNQTYELDTSIFTVSKYTAQNIVVNVSCSGGERNGYKIKFSKAGTYILTYEIVDNTFYTANGVRNDTPITYTYNVKVVVKNSNHPNAVIDLSGLTKEAKWERSGWFLDYNYSVYYEVLGGIVITDYNEDGTAFTVNITPSNLNGLTIKTSDSEITGVKIDGSKYWLYDIKADDNKANKTTTITYTYTGMNGTTVTKSTTFTISK